MGGEEGRGNEFREPLHLSSGQGRGILLFGAFAAAAGTFALLRALSVTTAGRANAPLWVIGAFGALFLIAGLYALVLGITSWRGTTRTKSSRLLFPDQRWRWDHPWDPEAIPDGSLRRALQNLFGALFLSVFLTPFVWLGFLSRHRNLFVQAFVVLFGLFAAYVLGRGVLRLLRVLKYGQGRLRLGLLPLRPGQHVDAVLELRTFLSNTEALEADLLFVEEATVTTGKGNNRTTQRIAQPLWQHSWSIDQPGADSLGGGEIPISFDMPVEPPGMLTAMSSEPRRYWELNVRLRGPGIDYHARFPLPVYEREGEPGLATVPGNERAAGYAPTR